MFTHKNIMIILSFMCILFISGAYGAEENSDSGDVIIPQGMEVIKEGSVNVVVPKGGRLRKQDSVMLIETADEYAARKFKDTDDRFKKLEKELEAQRRELENTGKELRDLKSVVINSSEEDGRKKLPIPAILKQNALDDS